MRSSFCSDFVSTFLTVGNLHENSLSFLEFIQFSCLFPTPSSICSWNDHSMWCSRITSGASWADFNWGINERGSREWKVGLAMQSRRQTVMWEEAEEHYQDAWSPSGALFGGLLFPAICRWLQTFIPCFVICCFKNIPMDCANYFCLKSFVSQSNKQNKTKRLHKAKPKGSERECLLPTAACYPLQMWDAESQLSLLLPAGRQRQAAVIRFQL